VTNLLNTEDVSSLFPLEEEATVLNSVRTQVQQAGLTFSRAVAWEFFLRYVFFKLILYYIHYLPLAKQPFQHFKVCVIFLHLNFFLHFS